MKCQWESFIKESFNSNPCFLTNSQIQQLHRRFGHPSVQRLHDVLDAAGHDVQRQILEFINKHCRHCQIYRKSPGRFRFTLKDDVQFNHTVYVDTMYIDDQPVLYVVDEATGYQAARFLGPKGGSAQNIYDILRLCWIDVYQGPPDWIVHDAGTNFMSKEFAQSARVMGSRVKPVPIEAHNSIGKTERYHALVRRAYRIIKDEVLDIGDDVVLQMAVKTVNDTAGPSGLVLTLLVYGAYPRLTEFDAPSPGIA
jgi:hypothetical protein